MIDAISQFQVAMRAVGLEPPEVIEAGKLQRFPGIGKRNSNTAGWCIFFEDGLGGCFGDWSSGLSEQWQANRVRPFTANELTDFKRRVAEAQARTDAERKIRQAEAATKATASRMILNSNNREALLQQGLSGLNSLGREFRKSTTNLEACYEHERL